MLSEMESIRECFRERKLSFNGSSCGSPLIIALNSIRTTVVSVVTNNSRVNFVNCGNTNRKMHSIENRTIRDTQQT